MSTQEGGFRKKKFHKAEWQCCECVRTDQLGTSWNDADCNRNWIENRTENCTKTHERCNNCSLKIYYMVKIGNTEQERPQYMPSSTFSAKGEESTEFTPSP
ncbi:hypothetical protein HYALB_00006603 [Hymenoscyphus albidus]|uniref:Uncharacterized protein n=1 Tax=Hymenoscyphus albidus TaxID=595503 RepID=A0A9N9PWP1_9HELO|nr:hypothetical protein HYALB_00006603 [Hymenoscyphus albidus]